MIKISNDIKNRSDELIHLRRELHKIPELYFKEFDTSKMLQKLLKEKGIEFDIVAQTGLVLTLAKHLGGEAIMFRADMDALSILEENSFDYVSRNEGAMHACGHDAHMDHYILVERK
ncbi:hypothetical protein MJH12_10520 [bacterium]|nr:hypothetical protein [bacterium]